MNGTEKFLVGPLIALDGGDGEAVAVATNRVATLGAMQATWWVDAVPHRVELPGVRVRGARWSINGDAVLAGTGFVNVVDETWTTHPAFERLVQSSAPGHGGIEIQATSWSLDQSHAAALLAWSGPTPESGEIPDAEVVLLDLDGESEPIRIPAAGASALRIVRNHLVVAQPSVRIWNFAGDEVAVLPATPGAPLALAGGDNGDPLVIIDANWSIRVVDTATWTVQANWQGTFFDAATVPGGIIAIDHEGVLHAGCFSDSEISEVGTFETGILAAQLAATTDGHLAIIGAGPAAVHVAPFQLNC